ncbi:hypothetical protein GCM10009798_05010 [Nocardioides panacihumi]|uniref:Glycosyl hydrolase n=1 Tax=Nocardioides panacihumi TaxID=400774 RepID=A0ABN2QE89_9ACTN
MHPASLRRGLIGVLAVTSLTLTAACSGVGHKSDSDAEREREAAAAAGLKAMPQNALEKYMMIAGTDPDEAAKESKESATIGEQFAEARTAPGVVDSGAYTAAFNQIKNLPISGGSWADVTKVPYNSDDPRYRDYYSNSSGGSGFVSGRITGIAADNNGAVYAASADGGVWRSTSGGGHWVPISDQLPSISSGDLTLAKDGSLWYATGEANTGGTAYAGAGVYRLTNPRTGEFTPADRVGGQELDSTTIGRIRFGGGRVWAATNRGVWSHADNTASGAWTFHYAPNMAYMPLIKDDAGNVIVPRGSACTGNTTCGATNAAYKNIVNDIAVDPTNSKHVIAAIGWRSGDTYNGFYESKDAGASWTKINPTGAMPADDIGYVTFAWAADSSKLYAINQSPKLLNKASGTVNSYLDGIYVSNSGSVNGPWTKVATSTKLASSGSALKQSVGGKGYGPGIQAWYNQFLTVDPTNPQHLYAGLEEVYETKNGGASWTTPGPYWNFYFGCWDISNAKNTCSTTTHSDQHASAIGTVNGVPTFFAGNDGGIYSRPVDGKADGEGHATDWKSLTRDGSMDSLQYYSVAWGADKDKGGLIVSGGAQDNGTTNLRGVQPNGTNKDTEMGSPFGGDGGDAAADPADGCRQVQEYTGLAMSVTENCAQNPGAVTTDTATSWRVGPADPLPRFIAPFDIDRSDASKWIAAGQYVWTQGNGFKIRSRSEWAKSFDLGAGHSATAVAMDKGVGYVGWCGPCNNNGFARGLATNASGSWQAVTLPASVPNRYIGGIGIDPANPKHAFLAMNGFSRRFTEGPGAGIGHVFETTDGGVTWTDVSANLPDVPTNSVKETKDGALVVGSDLGVFYRAAGATTWSRLGGNLPYTTVMDVELAADGNVYAATHGRGIWSIPLPKS